MSSPLPTFATSSPSPISKWHITHWLSQMLLDMFRIYNDLENWVMSIIRYLSLWSICYIYLLIEAVILQIAVVILLQGYNFLVEFFSEHAEKNKILPKYNKAIYKRMTLLMTDKSNISWKFQLSWEENCITQIINSSMSRYHKKEVVTYL